MNNYDNISQQQVEEVARSLINYIRKFVDEHRNEFEQIFTDEPRHKKRH